MTALNVFAQPRGRAGYVLTDAAYTDAEGRLRALGSKIIYGTAHFPWAAGVSGNVSPQLLGHELAVVGVGSLKQLRKRLGPAMQRAIAATASHSTCGSLIHCGVEGVAWDFAAKRPIVFAMMSHPQCLLGDPTLEAFAWYETTWLVSCDHPSGIAGLMGRVPDFTDPADFDPTVDGLKLIEAQRKIGMIDTDPNRQGEVKHRIGGEAHLARVTRSGVEIERLVAWADAIGEPITPELISAHG